jgi:group I intron endonuclease
MGVIYKILSPSGRLYIGQTQNLRKRINAYKCDVRKDRKDIKLHNSLRKYGWDAHVLEVIEEVADELMDEREIYWIAELKTYCYKYPEGLNMTEGGDGQRSTWMHDIERRRKQAQRFSGEGNPFYGKKHTKEYRAKKAKQVSEYNKKHGVMVPEWGVEKGREAVRKKILCYDLQGNFLKEYNSLSSASAELSISHQSITDSLTKRKSQAKGYVFRYKTDNYPLKIEVGVIKNKTVKRPVIGVYAGEVMVFTSSTEASSYYGIPKTTINRAAQYNNGKPIRSGHEFYYQKQNRPHIAGRAA